MNFIVLIAVVVNMAVRGSEVFRLRKSKGNTRVNCLSKIKNIVNHRALDLTKREKEADARTSFS